MGEGVVSVLAAETDTGTNADSPSDTGAVAESCFPAGRVADLTTSPTNTDADAELGATSTEAEGVVGTSADLEAFPGTEVIAVAEVEVASAAVPKVDVVIDVGIHTSKEVVGDSGGVAGVGALPLKEKDVVGDKEARV
jgi:hypothetical protein